MNRCPVGSSVGSSGEGVWALSCSLLENFTPSDESTPLRFTPTVHPVLKKFSNFQIFSDPRATAPMRFKTRPLDHPMPSFT
jgi:hypothetical protein